MITAVLKRSLVPGILICLAVTTGWTTLGFCGDEVTCTIRQVTLERQGGADVIRIRAEGALGRVRHFALESPPRIVVDLYGCKADADLVPRGGGKLVSGPLRVGRHPGKVRVAGDLPEDMDLRREVLVDKTSVTVRLIPPAVGSGAAITAKGAGSVEKAPWGKEEARVEEKQPQAEEEKAPWDKPEAEASGGEEKSPWQKDAGERKAAGGEEKSLWAQETPASKGETEKSPWAQEEPGPKEKESQGSPWAELKEKGAEEKSPWAEEKAPQGAQKESPWEELKEKGTAGTREKPPWEEGSKEEAKAGEETPPWEEKSVQEKSPFEFSGKFWNKLAGDVEEENRYEDDASNHAEVLVEGKYTAGPVLALLSVEAQHFADLNHGEWDGEADLDLFNAYVNYSGDHYNIRLGQQIVKWGKADEISPLDIVNPEDMRDGPLRPRDERKLPIPMLNMEVFKGVYKVQGIYIPFFHESRFDLKGDDWAFFDHYQDELGYFQVKEKDVPHSFKNGEAGIRASGTVRNFDYAVSYFYTRDDLPSLGAITVPAFFPLPVTNVTIRKLAQTSRTLNQPVPLTYDRTRVTGFEFETTLGDFGVRGEAAYYNKQSFLTNRLKKVRKPVFQYALGMDYQGKESFYVNLQFLQAIVRDYDDDILFTEKTTSLCFVKISRGFLDDNLELGLRAYYNMKDKDYYYNPMLTIKYWQDVNIELGADILGGHSDTTMGLFRDNDQVYAILRYFF
ncbi:MAG: hypothetical protein JRJ35_09340 [Deltaproteobacteria bacterium]|nr:hypothetical protein [Deltaproteobacteria bacterium]